MKAAGASYSDGLMERTVGGKVHLGLWMIYLFTHTFYHVRRRVGQTNPEHMLSHLIVCDAGFCLSSSTC